MSEMLILLIDSFERRANVLRVIVDNQIVSYSMDYLCSNVPVCIRVDRNDCD